MEKKWRRLRLSEKRDENKALERKLFSKSQTSGLLNFAEHYGLAPFNPTSVLKRFLNQFITSMDRVIDVHVNGERVGAAMLLDKIQNPSNSACLELIGVNKNKDPKKIMDFILAEAEKGFPKNRNGIEVSYHHTHPFSRSLISSKGYKPHYETFNMSVKTIKCPVLKLPANFQWVALSEKNFKDYYTVLTKSFERNLETSIPPINEMKLSYRNRKIPVLLLKDQGATVGFLSVDIDERQSTLGEVHTIGVLPSYRGRQLGKILLKAAIELLGKNGASEFKLTVAANNSNALKLYEAFGFKITDSYSIFRKAL